MKFAHPFWLFGALFALAVAGLLVLGAFAGVRALRRFGEPAPVESLLTARVGSRRALKGALSVLALAACFVALAQPQYGWGTRRIPATNLDVAVVLDYSKSMYARDVPPSRIERAKAEVGRLIADLPGARFGAVAFAGEGMVFPLTSDGAAIAQFFRQLSPNDMPVGGTAIARALEAARSLGHPFVITGRTEALLYGHDGGMDEALARLQGFAEVGAGCLYAPGTWDLDAIRTITAEAGGPVNVLVPLSEVSPRGPAPFGVAELAEIGVRRISIGGSLYRSQVAHAADRVEQVAGLDPTRPWFAIGGIDLTNIDQVLSAGATRVVVVRAITEAEDPRAAAHALKARLTARVDNT